MIPACLRCRRLRLFEYAFLACWSLAILATADADHRKRSAFPNLFWLNRGRRDLILANIGEVEANPALRKNRLALSTHLCATSVPFLFDTFGANWLRGVPKRRIPVQKGWQFAVVGCDANEVPHYLGFAETYDRAAQLRESTKLLGWRRVAVFDAELRELTAKPNA
jgi:hypothetical protein